jgi:hypothetical protein
VGGLFVASSTPRPIGAKARVDFLVPEGQIRAQAVVQHQLPNGGLGLKFTAITDQDCPNLVALLNRIGSTAPNSSFAASQQQHHFSTENL